MNIKKIEALLAAIDHMNISHAAEALHYSQSCISRAIRDLEEDLGLILLDRHKGGVKITPECEALLPYFKSLTSNTELLIHKANELRGLEFGMIRIGSFSSFAAHRLPDLLGEFHKKYPNIQYELMIGEYDDIDGWLLTGQIDCGFTIYDKSSKLALEKIEKDPLLAVLPRDHPLCSRKRIHVRELLKDPFLMNEKANTTAEFSEVFLKEQVWPHVQLTTEDDHFILAMVERGLGITMMTSMMIEEESHRITALPLSPSVSRTLAFATQSNAHISFSLQKFKELVLSKLHL